LVLCAISAVASFPSIIAYVFLVTIALLPECILAPCKKLKAPEGKVILSQNAKASQEKLPCFVNFFSIFCTATKIRRSIFLIFQPWL